MKQKIVIYQVLPRLFGNVCRNQIINGDIKQNGCGKFNDITDKVLLELKSFGITHIWLTGIIRHATLSSYPQIGLAASHPDIVKGKAGSPYAINDYYDVDPDLAEDVSSRMEEFQQLIKRIHLLGLKAIIDFVPNHVARDYYSKQLPKGTRNLGESDNKMVSFSPSNNFYYFPEESFQIRRLNGTDADSYHEFPARVTGNDVFRPDPDINDWYETVKINYGVDYTNGTRHFKPIPDTWIKMTEILLFWSQKGVDGFRCDMAGMVPVEFWQYAISQVKREHQLVIFIAELYEPTKYRDYLETGFFDFLYDKVGLYDTLRSVITRTSTTREITRVWQALEGLDDLMVRFLENHDEQRIASGFFASDPWKALPAMAISAFMNQGPLLIYSGQEVGEPAKGISGFSGDDGRTSIFDYCCLPELQKWFNHGQCDGQNLSDDQRQLRGSYSAILHLCQKYPVLANGNLYDLMWLNEDNPERDKIFAFLRYGSSSEEEALLIVTSFENSLNETIIKIGEHAMQTLGFDTRQRFSIQSIEPVLGIQQNLLYSQIISIGLNIQFNKAGFAVLSIN